VLPGPSPLPMPGVSRQDGKLTQWMRLGTHIAQPGVSMMERDTLSWHSLGESDVPTGREWLSALEVERMVSMRFTKRRSEWLLARWTGKQAIAHHLGLGLNVADLARVELRSVMAGAAKGAPEVFVDGARVPVAVSMTDRAGWAVCTVGGGRAIGCDLELVEPRSLAFVRDYLTTSEQDIVWDPPFEASPDLLANLIWSAKESALKVLRTGLRRPTRSVEVAFESDVSTRGWRPLVVRAEEGTVFPGWWRQYGQFLLTVVADADVAPPDPCVKPPGLAAARPSHSWMVRPLVDPE
jgi:4'-phosphopantetheinyl transferase